ERDQVFAQQPQADGCAVRLWHFGGDQCWHPEAPQQRAHWRPRSHPTQVLVLRLAQHPTLSLSRLDGLDQNSTIGYTNAGRVWRVGPTRCRWPVTTETLP